MTVFGLCKVLHLHLMTHQRRYMLQFVSREHCLSFDLYAANPPLSSDYIYHSCEGYDAAQHAALRLARQRTSQSHLGCTRINTKFDAKLLGNYSGVLYKHPAPPP